MDTMLGELPRCLLLFLVFASRGTSTPIHEARGQTLHKQFDVLRAVDHVTNKLNNTSPDTDNGIRAHPHETRRPHHPSRVPTWRLRRAVGDLWSGIGPGVSQKGNQDVVHRLNVTSLVRALQYQPEPLYKEVSSRLVRVENGHRGRVGGKYSHGGERENREGVMAVDVNHGDEEAIGSSWAVTTGVVGVTRAPRSDALSPRNPPVDTLTASSSPVTLTAQINLGNTRGQSNQNDKDVSGSKLKLMASAHKEGTPQLFGSDDQADGNFRLSSDSQSGVGDDGGFAVTRGGTSPGMEGGGPGDGVGDPGVSDQRAPNDIPPGALIHGNLTTPRPPQQTSSRPLQYETYPSEKDSGRRDKPGTGLPATEASLTQTDSVSDSILSGLERGDYFAYTNPELAVDGPQISSGSGMTQLEVSTLVKTTGHEANQEPSVTPLSSTDNGKGIDVALGFDIGGTGDVYNSTDGNVSETGGIFTFKTLHLEMAFLMRLVEAIYSFVRQVMLNLFGERELPRAVPDPVS